MEGLSDLLWHRIISAIIGIPILLLFTYWGGMSLVALVIILSLIGNYESIRIYRRMQFRVPCILLYASALFFPLLVYLAPSGVEGTYLSVGIVAYLILHLMLLVFAFPKYDLGDIAISYLGSCYISVLLSCLILIREWSPNGLHLLFLVFLLTWACDIGAYFIGRLLGSTPLCSKLSPHKTVEGAIGGIFFSLGVAVVFRLIFPVLTFSGSLLFGLALGFFVQIGDLVESSIKRMGGVKDSGTLIPGHGGILDRFDSILFAAPVAYILIKLFL